MSTRPDGYYLICDPTTKTVVRKSHSAATAKEMNLVSLSVDKNTWKSFRAGDLVMAVHLPMKAYDWWMRVLDRVDRTKV